MDISRTVPQAETVDWVNSFFDGTWPINDPDWPLYFPSAGPIANLNVGDYLYIIYRGLVRGRLRIREIEHVENGTTLEVGSNADEVPARVIICVDYPGESVGERIVPCSGHRGHKYVPTPLW
jgi:hypothetical protein